MAERTRPPIELIASAESSPLFRQRMPAEGSYSPHFEGTSSQDVSQSGSAPKRTWTINGRFLTQSMTGVQRYALEIVSALDTLLSEGHPSSRGLRLELLVPGNPPMPSFKSIAVRKTQRVPGHLWEQSVLPLLARGGVLSLCNTSTVLKRKQIVCVHDLNFKAFPQSYSFAFRTVYGALIPRLLRTSAGITTVSLYSASELSRAGFAALDRIRVVPDGHEHIKRWVVGTPSPSFAFDSSTIIAIGSPAAHKNLDLIVRLSARLASEGLRVAFVGALDTKVFQRSGIDFNDSAITWLGRVTDEELAAYYQNCFCLAFPSHTEGFGLPPLEAMTLGCPVVSSDTASMPDVCGDAALYAAPDDDEAWLHAFLRLRDTPGLRQTLIENGHRRAELFSWRASAESYLELMRQIDGPRNLAASHSDETISGRRSRTGARVLHEDSARPGENR